jgi:hypothetical protein
MEMEETAFTNIYSTFCHRKTNKMLSLINSTGEKYLAQWVPAQQGRQAKCVE